MSELFYSQRRIDAFTAAALGDLETLEEVVSSNNINLKNIDGWTLLMYACYYDRLETVQFLVTLRANKMIRCKKGRTALMIAAMSGNVQIIPLVLVPEILEFKEAWGMTALWFSIENGHQNAAETLLSYGANPDVLFENETPLMLAARQGNFSLAKMLLSFRANPLIINSKGKTAKEMAYEKEHHDIVKLINAFEIRETRDIQFLLSNLGLGAYLQNFEVNDITFQELLDMSEEDLKSIGITKFGPRRKLTIFINQLKERHGIF